MAEEVLAFVPDRPVRVKITNPDGSWSKATLPRVPHPDEPKPAGETYEVLDDEPAFDGYGEPLAPEYSAPAQPAKKAAASPKEAVQ